MGVTVHPRAAAPIVQAGFLEVVSRVRTVTGEAPGVEGRYSSPGGQEQENASSPGGKGMQTHLRIISEVEQSKF